MEIETAELLRLLVAVNGARQRSEIDTATEALAEARTRASRRLAVYGTLAPGRPNHHVVAPLGGHWEAGFVEGHLAPLGWGAALGFPALRLEPGGPAVPVQLLTAEALPGAWERLDAFEGAEYRRILVPVWRVDGGDRRLLAVANLYAVAAGP